MGDPARDLIERGEDRDFVLDNLGTKRLGGQEQRASGRKRTRAPLSDLAVPNVPVHAPQPTAPLPCASRSG